MTLEGDEMVMRWGRQIVQRTELCGTATGTWYETGLKRDMVPARGTLRQEVGGENDKSLSVCKMQSKRGTETGRNATDGGGEVPGNYGEI